MRLVPIGELTTGNLLAWSELATHTVEPNPFFEKAFVTAACELTEIDPPELLLLEDGGDWTACIPVRVHRLAGRPVALSGWKHPYGYLDTPLVREGSLAEFTDSLGEYLSGSLLSPFFLLRQTNDSAVAASIRAATVSGSPRLALERTGERAAFRRSAEPEAHLTMLKPRRRRELEKRRKLMCEELESAVAVVDRSADPGAVDQFLRLEASGWKGRQGTAMQTAGHGEFFRSICQVFAAEDRLQMLSLEAQGRVLAMQCNLSANRTLFNFKVAYDEDLKRFAPGILLEFETMRIFQTARDEELLDSCANPNDGLMNRLWPDRLPLASLVLGPRGPLGRLGSRVLETAYERRARR